MSDLPVIRLAQEKDQDELFHIWMEVFGDSRGYIENFFRYMYLPGEAIVAEIANKIVSAVYLIPVGDAVFANGSIYPCTVSYAFATLPQYRGRGYGGQIARTAIQKSIADGFLINTICPAEDGLFSFYNKKVGYKDFFCIDERIVSHDEFLKRFSSCALERVSSTAYAVVREQILQRRTHIRFSQKAMQYQERLCTESGGGLFVIYRDGKSGCAAVERRDEKTVLIKELLVQKGEEKEVICAISSIIEAEKFILRMPVNETSCPSVRRFAMIQSVSDKQSDTGDLTPWYGFAFD